jgi:UDPglucose--hexose-1-phosphate uridylyltransferase
MTPPPVLVLPDDTALVEEGSWSVRVVPNKYPALVDQPVWDQPMAGLYRSLNATGVHEVVIESARHVVDVAALGTAQIERVFHAYRRRMLHLRNDPRWQYALFFKNQGIAAGASLSHVHSQMTALPMVPREPLDELEAGKEYYASTGRCVYCDVARRESETAARIVTENEGFIVFCPFASRVPAEMWILPKRHSSCFDSGTAAEFRDLAHSLREALTRLAQRFHRPAFNYYLHSNPLGEPESPRYHWHLEILPRLQYFAAFESGSGLYMNSLAPEEAARLLRAVVL